MGMLAYLLDFLAIVIKAAKCDKIETTLPCKI